MDPDLLKNYIQEGGLKPDVMNNIEKLKALTNQATGATPWRKEGIKYKRNEVYIDVVESINLLMSSRGTILKVDVSG